MKVSAYLLAAAGIASAHNTFPKLMAGGTVSAEWEYVRRTANKWSHEGLTNVGDSGMTCYEESGRPAAGVLDVTAGSSVGFEISSPIKHIGPVMYYIAKIPDGQDADTWKPSGSVWAKIGQEGPETGGSGWTWPTVGKPQVEVTLPSALADGQYLLRVEHIAIHDAGYVGGAQFYLACGQINVTGGGSSTPPGQASFPGTYSAQDPGILIDLNGPAPSTYEFPGPEVWTG